MRDSRKKQSAFPLPPPPPANAAFCPFVSGREGANATGISGQRRPYGTDRCNGLRGREELPVSAEPAIPNSKPKPKPKPGVQCPLPPFPSFLTFFGTHGRPWRNQPAARGKCSGGKPPPLQGGRKKTTGLFTSCRGSASGRSFSRFSRSVPQECVMMSRCRRPHHRHRHVRPCARYRRKEKINIIINKTINQLPI